MIQINHDRCDLCGTCVAVCPADCLILTDKYLEIRQEECIHCGRCVRICPVEALTEDDSDEA